MNNNIGFRLVILFLILSLSGSGCTKKENKATAHRSSPNLAVELKGPKIGRPGDEILYTIKLKNKEKHSLKDLSLIAKLPKEYDFMSATEGYIYYEISACISSTKIIFIPYLRWDLPEIQAKSTKQLNIQVKLRFLGLGQIVKPEKIYVLPKEEADHIFSSYNPYGDHD